MMSEGTGIELKPLNKQLEPTFYIDRSYLHLQKTIHGTRQTKATVGWNIATLTVSSALAIFGAWVFITPAIKAITDSERMRYYLRECSVEFIEALGKVAGVESFLSNCGVNFDCINEATKEWEASLEALHELKYENIDTWYDWVLEYCTAAFKYIWTLASVVPYYMLSLNDDFVKGASTFVKHLYSLVITASLFFVQLRGIAQIQKDLASSNWFNAILPYADNQEISTKKFRRAQTDYFNSTINKVETAGEALFTLTSNLVELAFIDDKEQLLKRWEEITNKHQFLLTKHYEQLGNTIEEIGLEKDLDKLKEKQLQLYFDIMYHLEQMVADKDFILNLQVPGDEPDELPTLQQQREAAKNAEKVQEPKWTDPILTALKYMIKAVAKLLFIYYAANYLFSVVGYGLDAGYAMAEKVPDEWKDFVFSLVNISSNLAFFGLCLPSMNDGWEILCDIFINYPWYLIKCALHYFMPTIFDEPEFDGYVPLEKQFNRIAYGIVVGLTVLACVFSGGTNARVNEVNIPKYFSELGFDDVVIAVLDFHAWIFAWISSAIMNTWFTMNVTLAGLSKLYSRFDAYQETLAKKDNWYRTVDEMGTYSLNSTRFMSKFLRPAYQKELIEQDYVTENDFKHMVSPAA